MEGKTYLINTLRLGCLLTAMFGIISPANGAPTHVHEKVDHRHAGIQSEPPDQLNLLLVGPRTATGNSGANSLCAPLHLEGCKSKEECLEAGGYWYKDECHTKGDGGPGDPGDPGGPGGPGGPGDPSGEIFYYRGLGWQKNHPHGSVPPKTQQEAIAYCSSLSLGGFTSWRLPTKDELKTLVLCSNGPATPLYDLDEIDNPWKCNEGSVVPTFPEEIRCTDLAHTNFGSIPCPADTGAFWTSTPNVKPDIDVDAGYVVEFTYGNTRRYPVEFATHHRCVIDSE